MAKYESIPVTVNADQMRSRLDLTIAKALLLLRGCKIIEEFLWLNDQEDTKEYEHLLYIKFSDPNSNRWWILFNGDWLVDTPDGLEVLKDEDFHKRYRVL